MSTVIERVELLERISDLGKGDRAQALRKAIHDRSPTVRGVAVELICERGVNHLLPLVRQALTDPNAEVRALAVEGISKAGINNFPTADVARLLRDKDELVRVAAAEALASANAYSALPKLHETLHDHSSLVRGYVAEAIGTLGKPSDRRLLEAGLNTEIDSRARVGFYVGLSLLDGRDVVPDLLQLFADPDYRVRSSIVNSFQQLKLNAKQKSAICAFLKKSRRTEQTVAVRSSIDTVLRALCSR